MGYDYLMNTASALFFLCYLPELYANYKNKNANIYNLPEKLVLLAGTTFSLAYAILNEDQSLIINYAPIFAMDILACGMRGYYVWQTYRRAQNRPIALPDLEEGLPPQQAPSA